MDRSTLIKNRFTEVVQNGELMMGDEMAILELILHRLHPIPISDYAKKEGITFNGAKKRIQNGKVAYIEMGSKTFVIV